MSGYQNKKRAIFAGTFNPFHNGHADVVKQCLIQGLVNEIRIFVSIHTSLKPKIFADMQERRGIIQEWITQNESWLKGRVHVFDGDEDKKSAEFFKNEGFKIKICGSDQFSAYLHKKEFLEMFKYVDEFLLVDRPSFEVDKRTLKYYTETLHKSVKIIKSEKNSNISSSDVRDRIARQKTIRDMVPKELEQKIYEIYEPLVTGL